MIYQGFDHIILLVPYIFDNKFKVLFCIMQSVKQW